ncbi:hypothetical protein ACFT7S_31600 [Streptomyces sp. NPDC057136]|uniref:hypothetical protein n=1 Tax=Streptomyces sp. NPDC057136 TaxID=3346029 RepID=UPI00363EC11D
MSTAPAHGPRDSKPQQPQEHQQQPPQESEPTSALVFDDPLDRQSSDDTDRGWGERTPSGGSAADLARFLDEKPPHHI